MTENQLSTTTMWPTGFCYIVHTYREPICAENKERWDEIIKNAEVKYYKNREEYKKDYPSENKSL